MVEYLLQSRSGVNVTARLSNPSDVIHVPHLLAVEVSQVLRRMEKASLVEPDRAREATLDLADLDAVRHSHEDLLPRMWELRQNLTCYDAAYVALAEDLDAPLLTLDSKLANAPGNSARIELVE